MKKSALVVIVTLLSLNLSAQSNYPFDVKIIGNGNKSAVLMPGLSCSGEVWKETVDRYKKEYTCYVLTMHGFAGVKADSNTSYKNWETGIAKYITDNKLNKPVFIGHSIGGGMAMMLASDYPDLLSKIIVVDALPCLGALSGPDFVANNSPDCSMFVTQFQSMNNEQFYQMQKQSMPSMMSDTVHLAKAIDWSVKSDRKSVAEIYCQFGYTDMRKIISKIKCPSLVLLETSFADIKPIMEEQFKLFKTAQLEYAPKALHFIMYDDTEWYFRQMDTFLK